MIVFLLKRIPMSHFLHTFMIHYLIDLFKQICNTYVTRITFVRYRDHNINHMYIILQGDDRIDCYCGDELVGFSDQNESGCRYQCAMYHDRGANNCVDGYHVVSVPGIDTGWWAGWIYVMVSDKIMWCI